MNGRGVAAARQMGTRQGLWPQISLVALALALLTSCGSPGAAAAPSKTAHLDLSSVTLRVAEQVKGVSALLQASGQLKGVPYHIEWSEFSAAAPQLQALAAGAADVGLAGDAPTINAIAQAAPIRILAATQPAAADDYAGLSIVVKKSSGIKTVADLKGKTVSPTTQGSVGHQLVLAALDRARLNPGQVKLVMLPPADARAAFNTGAVDAWSTWDPYVATAQLSDQARILTTSQGLSPRLGFLDATSSTIADKGKHAAVQDLLGRLARAYAWSANHVKQWAGAYSTLYSTPLPVAELVEGRAATRFVPVDRSVVSSLQGIADLYGRYGVIKPANVSSAFDHSFSVPSTGV